mgnify:FL=1
MMTNYKNVSLSKKTHSLLVDLTSKILPGVRLSIAKLIEFLANEKAETINMKKGKKNEK